MRRSFLGTLAWSSLALTAACGGKVIFEQPSGAGGAQTGSSTASFAQNSATGGVTHGSTGSTGVNGSASVGNGSASVGTTGGTSGSGLPPVYCNGAPCAPGEQCCFNPNGPGDHCFGNGSCSPPDVVLSCSQAADCPGEICCAHVDPMGTYQGIACAQSCSDPGDHVICTKNPGLCPPGQSCHFSMKLGNGYRICY